MNILSLYDGMACGYISFKLAGVPIDRYDAYEIDKYAVLAATHNFPDITEHGDVFEGDFKQYGGGRQTDFLIGGSPCTYWSIAQSSDKRETTASGMGWELFQQYIRALKETEPKYFIYENNKSMSKDIYNNINETFGFEGICINSALVSAQNRQRLYWVGKRNEKGTYDRVVVEQPIDRGILLKDILDSTIAYKTVRCCDQTDFSELSESVAPLGEVKRVKHTLTANYCKAENNLCSGYVEEATMPRTAGPVVVSDVNGKSTTLMASARHTHIYNCIANSFQKSTAIAEPVAFSIYGTSGVDEKVGYYAYPTEFDEQGAPIKAQSITDGKVYTVYEVTDKIITIKGKSYPIKLNDGFYIIRSLTVSECKRLQTVPEWYEFPVSNSQAYKMLGNGWTCEVIVHLIKSALNNNTEKVSKYAKQSFFDMFDI